MEESGLHQLSPYIGRMKSSMARQLVAAITKPGDTVLDPFSGSGTIALEAWIAGRSVIANDLNPYAALLTRAKLHPYRSLGHALNRLAVLSAQAEAGLSDVDLRRVPRWVRAFFHPETLREAIAWTRVLRATRSHFLLACLLGILHHQRPGFLSYPSSHSVPYLRDRKYPREAFPELYEYRDVRSRLERKVERSFRRRPELDFGLRRECHARDARSLSLQHEVRAVVTSPPYMSQLDYARDNRLRLWFLGHTDWRVLESSLSPAESRFFDLMESCFALWRRVTPPGGSCVLVLGDKCTRKYNNPLPDAIQDLATRAVGGYSLVFRHSDTIPDLRRVRRCCRGSVIETVMVFQRE
ncbi:MAG: DNA methyltransferase [Armatimonadota bacterium]